MRRPRCAWGSCYTTARLCTAARGHTPVADVAAAIEYAGGNPMRQLYLITAVCVFGCGGAPPSPDGPGGKPIDAGLGDVPGHAPGTPGAAAHGINFYHLADPHQPGNTRSISTPKLVTQASGSVIVVGLGRGDNTLFGSQ